MTEIVNAEQPVAQGEELDDFDVEGHGFKEIALGLSAATIVAGGAGAAALAMDNPLPGTTSGVQAAVAGVQKDVHAQHAWAERVAGELGDRAGQEVGSALRDADRLTTWTTTTVTTTTTPIKDRVDAAVTETTDLAEATVADTAELAQQVLDDPMTTTDRVVDAAMVTARDTRDKALATAEETATEAVESATSTAGDVQEVAISTAGDVQELVDPQANVTLDDGGATVQVGAAGASVTVSTG